MRNVGLLLLPHKQFKTFYTQAAFGSICWLLLPFLLLLLNNTFVDVVTANKRKSVLANGN